MQLKSHVSAVDTEDGLVLLDERFGRYWQLNRTGAFVLRLLLGGAGIGDAAARLSSSYGVSEARAVPDVEGIVAQLETARLISGKP